MSSLTMRSLRLVLPAALLAAVSACSDPASSNFNTDTGKHTASWLPASHSDEARMSTAGCAECHGLNLDGGISGISCTACHLGGPMSAHPADWTPMFSTHGPYALSNGTTACSNQHCHGSNLAGVANSGPSCTSCHSLPFDPATVACGACHRIPPSGSTFPNVAGAHLSHTAITGMTQPACAVCHNGSDGVIGTGAHYNGTVEVAVPSTYNAKTGTAAFNSGTAVCSNVSCHGGRTTPSWPSGSLDVNTACASCHQFGSAMATPQYNSFYSGEHDKHVNGEGFACTECHDTTKLATVHFTDLDTNTMTEAWKTIRSTLNYTGTGTGTGNCTLSCHGKNHSQLDW